MQLSLSIIDAFTSERFKGNQAAVVPLMQWLPDATLQAIASENNLSETAFVVWNAAHDAYDIRWFSPLTEIDFCGHATLATAYVLLQTHPDSTSIKFWASAVGHVHALLLDDGRIEMTFPRRDAAPLDTPPAALVAGLSPAPAAYRINAQAYMAIYATETEVRAVAPDLEALKTLGPRDVVVTAMADSGKPYDFVSRYFWPANGGVEDPVTGSIHTALAPHWAEQLGKTTLVAHQASQRSGQLFCEVTADHVKVAGYCVPYLQGSITVDA